MVFTRRLFLAALIVVFLASWADADTIWSGTSSSWSTSGNWIGGVPTSSIDADFINSAVPSIDLGGNQSVLGMSFGSFNYTISGAGNTLSIGADGISLSGMGSTQTISSSVTFTSSNPTVSLTSLSTLVLSGNSITGTSFTETGSGTLLITGSATFSSGATVSGGTLQIGNGGTNGTFSGNLTDNSAVEFNRSDAITYSGALSGSGTLMQAGSGTLVLNGTNTYTGGTTISSGTLQIGSGGTIGSISGNIQDNSAVAFNRSDTVTYSGAINGSGKLFQSGSGVLILTGNNSNSGGTTISSGSLQIGTGGTSGVLSGDVTDNGSLAFNRSDSVTYSGAISGSGKLLQSGSGVLILTGSNSYSGGTTLSSGTLQIGNGGTSGSISGNISNNARLAFNRSDSVTYSGTVSGSGTVVQAGTGTLILTGNNTFSGATTISSGTLQIGNASSTGSLSGSIVDNGNLTINRSNSDNFFNFVSGTGSLTQAGASGLVIFANNTYSGGTTISSGYISIGGGGTTGSISGNIINNASLYFDRSDNVTFAGNINGTGNVIKDSTTGTLTLTGSSTYSGGTTINLGTLQLGDGTTNGSIVGDVVNSGTLAFNRTGSSYDFNGNISGNGSVLQNGSATVRLGGSNTFSGGITISSGTLTIGTGGTTGSVTGSIVNNASLDFDRSDNITFAGNISGTGNLIKDSTAGTLILSGSNTYSGGTTINLGTLQIGDGTTNGSILGNIVNNASLDFNRSDNITFAGNISGTGNMTKDAAGTLILTGSNTYTGATTINSGTLQLGAGTSTGSLAGDILDNGTLVFNRSVSSYDFSGNISGTGSLIQNSSVTVRLGGSNTFTGGITVSAGTLTIGTAGSTGSITSNVSVGSTLIFNRTTDYSYAGNISGLGSLYKVNSNTLTLTGSSTYTGVTHLEGGLVNFTSLSNLGTGSLTFNGGGLQWATGSNTDISTRTVFIDTGGATLNTNGNNVTLANAIGNAGTGALTKSGSGTLTLSGTGNYTGATTVSAGTLVVSGSLSGTVSMSVSSGADLQVDGGVNPLALISVSGTLNGNGKVGSVSLSTTGTLVAGDGGAPGLLTLSGTSSGSSALSGTTGSGFLVELSKQTTGTPSAGTDYSQLKVTQGTISLSKITLTLAGNSTNVKYGDLFFIILNGSNSSTGTFNGLADQSTFTLGGQQYEISYFANHSTSTFATGGSFNDVALMAVPEPSPCALLLSALIVTFITSRKRVCRGGCVSRLFSTRGHGRI